MALRDLASTGALRPPVASIPERSCTGKWWRYDCHLRAVAGSAARWRRRPCCPAVGRAPCL